MDEITLKDAAQVLRRYLLDSGLADLVGGEEVLDEGLREAAQGLLPLAGELLVASERGDCLSEAVFQGDSYPHLVFWHGLLSDILIAVYPPEFRSWLEALVEAGPPPDAPELRKAMFMIALRSTDPGASALARFLLFEGIVLNMQLSLRAGDLSLESLGGSVRSVEAMAEREVEAALESEVYGDEVLAVEEPLRVLYAAAMVELDNHVADLRVQLTGLMAHMHAQLRAREEIIEVGKMLDPADAAILYNQAEVSGERLSVGQLRQQHPIVLGHLKPNSISQRARRVTDKAHRVLVEPVERKLEPSMAELLIDKIKREEPR